MTKLPVTYHDVSSVRIVGSDGQEMPASAYSWVKSEPAQQDIEFTSIPTQLPGFSATFTLEGSALAELFEPVVLSAVVFSGSDGHPIARITVAQANLLRMFNGEYVPAVWWLWDNDEWEYMLHAPTRVIRRASAN